MTQLFYMYTVSEPEMFYTEIQKLSKQKNASLFNCYIKGEIFVVSTAKKIMKFDFSAIEEIKAILLIEKAVYILRENLPEQILLFNDDLIKNK